MISADQLPFVNPAPTQPARSSLHHRHEEYPNGDDLVRIQVCFHSHRKLHVLQFTQPFDKQPFGKRGWQTNGLTSCRFSWESVPFSVAAILSIPRSSRTPFSSNPARKRAQDDKRCPQKISDREAMRAGSSLCCNCDQSQSWLKYTPLLPHARTCDAVVYRESVDNILV